MSVVLEKVTRDADNNSRASPDHEVGGADKALGDGRRGGGSGVGGIAPAKREHFAGSIIESGIR